MLLNQVPMNGFGGQSLLELRQNDLMKGCTFTGRFRAIRLAGFTWRAVGALVPFDSSEPVRAEPVGALVPFERLLPKLCRTAFRDTPSCSTICRSESLLDVSAELPVAYPYPVVSPWCSL